MKRILALILSVVMLFSLFGCSKNTVVDNNETTQPLLSGGSSNGTTGTTGTADPTDPSDPIVTPPENDVTTNLIFVDELSNPTFPTKWVATCLNSMSFWNYPGGQSIATIYPGDEMELRGWVGKYAIVSYNGRVGYVLGSYIKPADDSYFEECFDTVEPTSCYSYEQMLLDLAALEDRHPDRAVVDTIGKSALGRDIPVMRIGDLDAEYHVLIQGAMHAREHMTAWLLMAMIDYWLDRDFEGNENVCYHIIPMVNPDGVTISQTQTLTPEQAHIYQTDINRGHTTLSQSEYAKYWKSNGEGYDINRDFDARWESVIGRPYPSAEGSQGDGPFSTPEAAALRDYTLKYDFDTTISYHSNGCLIYYNFGDSNRQVNILSTELAKAVNEVNGYDLIADQGDSAAGYKDWAIDKLDIPSLTIEIGCESSPMPDRELYNVFVRNYRVIPVISEWLQS